MPDTAKGSPKVPGPPPPNGKGKEDKSVRLVLEYHCVLDLDLDKSNPCRNNVFCCMEVWPGAAAALIEGLRSQPNLEIAVLSYIGRYSADKRKETREKVEHSKLL